MTSPKPILPLCICRDPLCRIPYGYCHCECGGKVPLAMWTDRRRGLIKGLPVKRINGHGRVQRRVIFRNEEPFLVDGDWCLHLSLTRGMAAVVDANKLKEFSGKNWSLTSSKQSEKLYVARSEKVNGKKVKVFLHRLILGLPPYEPGEGDHKNGDTLDMRIRNLRPATHEENARNRGIGSNNTSGYKGVTYCKDSGKWRARIGVKGHRQHLGYFDTKEEAYAAYCEAALRLHGEFARLA